MEERLFNTISFEAHFASIELRTNKPPELDSYGKAQVYAMTPTLSPNRQGIATTYPQACRLFPDRYELSSLRFSPAAQDTEPSFRQISQYHWLFCLFISLLLAFCYYVVFHGSYLRVDITPRWQLWHRARKFGISLRWKVPGMQVPKEGERRPEEAGQHTPSEYRGQSLGRKRGRSRNNSSKRTEHDGDEDPDRRSDDSTPQKRSRLQYDDHHCRLLACPFWKLDPVQHYRCVKLRMDKISYVKQHLARKHTPKHYCDRCRTIFADSEAQMAHMNSAPGCTLNPNAKLDGVSYSQSRQLARKSKRDVSISEQWFAIWNILFPENPQPESPYIDPQPSMDLNRFQEFVSAYLPSTLIQNLHSGGLVSISNEDGIHEVIVRTFDQVCKAFESAPDAQTTYPSSNFEANASVQRTTSWKSFATSQSALGSELTSDSVGVSTPRSVEGESILGQLELSDLSIDFDELMSAMADQISPA